jgi:recombination protein RecR
MALVREQNALGTELISELEQVKQSVCLCSRCGSVTAREKDPCEICTSTRRDASQLCIVEEPSDIALIEGAGGYQGRYHALMGKLSPMKGSGPQQLRVDAMLERVDKEGFQEIIIAISTDVEGDATASYLAECLKKRNVRVTRLALGLPAGSGIAYSDATTLKRAFRGRWEA